MNKVIIFAIVIILLLLITKTSVQETFKITEPDFSTMVNIFLKDPTFMQRTRQLEPKIESALIYLDAPITSLNKIQVQDRFSALTFAKAQLNAAFQKALGDKIIPSPQDPKYHIFVNRIGMYRVLVHTISLYQQECIDYTRKTFEETLMEAPKPIDNMTVRTLLRL